ncbi:MAG: Flp family type IVb pilin [Acidobacteria bacterium]|nr:Flp family type IVb pilin [Acidobacteriota bacterium]
MREFFIKTYLTLQRLRDENGQDLIEYALVVALIALAATAGMSDVAKNINQAFNNIAKKLNTYTT